MQKRKIQGCLLSATGFLGLLGIVVGLILLFTEKADTVVVVIIEAVSIVLIVIMGVVGKVYTKNAGPEENELRKKAMDETNAVTHPDNHKKVVAEGVLYCYGAFNLFIGLVALIFDIGILKDLGLGVIQIIAGVILIMLAYLTGKKSILALLFAIILVAADLAGLIYLYAANWSLFSDIDNIPGLVFGGVFGAIVHIFVLRFLIPGVKAIHNLKKTENVSPPTARGL